MKTAGVVYDFYDDVDGRILKELFPTADDLPDVVKEAHILRPEERDVLRDDAFALVFQDSGKVFRKFACVDPGNTLLSLAYFEKTAALLPQAAREAAEAAIQARAVEFGLLEKEASLGSMAAEGAVMTGLAAGGAYGLSKLRGKKKTAAKEVPHKASGMSRSRDSMKQPIVGDEADWAQRTNLVSVRGGSDSGKVIPTANQMKTAAPLDLTGQEPVFEVSHAKAKLSALGTYPLDSYADVRAAVDYFATSWTGFDPKDRHEFAKVASARANEIGLEVPEVMARYGATGYAPDVEAHLAARRGNADPKFRGVYDALQEKRAALDPEMFADLLAKADEASGLAAYWGGPVADPWFSTFGGNHENEKTAFGWEGGGYAVDAEKLQEVAASGALVGHFEKDIVRAFEKDPVTIFSSLPDDTKLVIARLATEA
jgi:hypothetical protein